jgi:hypothetical protein
MAGQSVVDELVVKLTLDTESYEKAQHQIDINIALTEKKEKDRDKQRTTRERDQQSRWKSMATQAKGLGVQLAAVAGFVAAIGSAIVGSLSGLNTFELGLRRQGVATGLSNKEMQAWGSTARRLGADADAGASAIADLAREQKQFNLTGNAPTLQALSRIGVRASPNTPIQDLLGQAHSIYRAAPQGQKQQIESTLSASGVSGDLILLIKSEKDVREAYTKSLVESTKENEKALSDFNDALASAKNNAVSIANTLASVLAPAIKDTAEWFGKAAKYANDFGDKVQAAGGGAAGFLKVLNEESPVLAKSLRGLGDIVDVIAFGLKKLKEVIDSLTGAGGLGDRINDRIAAEVAKPDHNPVYGVLSKLQGVGKGIVGFGKGLWGETVDNAHAGGFNVLGGGGTAPAAGPGVATGASANAVMGTLISKYGFSIADAAAITSNAQGESGLDPSAFNPAGGGQGASGLFQLRGPRIDAFRARYGVNPDKATTDQQLEFLATDPHERALLNRALAAGGGASALGTSVSAIYEAHGNLAEDARRGKTAAALEAQYTAQQGGTAGAGTTAPVMITGPVTVVANNPQQLGDGLQRISNVQNYTQAQR